MDFCRDVFDFGASGMKLNTYIDLKEILINRGYASEIDWCEAVELCDNAETFALEAIWVIINGGMKNQVAEIIYKRVLEAIVSKQSISSAFKHPGKSRAIQIIIQSKEILYLNFIKSNDKIEYLQSYLPWIGKITKYHLARNLGLDVCKPDRHLVRIAENYNTTPHDLCKKISDAVGDRIGTVDVVLWRAANLGLI